MKREDFFSTKIRFKDKSEKAFVLDKLFSLGLQWWISTKVHDREKAMCIFIYGDGDILTPDQEDKFDQAIHYREVSTSVFNTPSIPLDPETISLLDQLDTLLP